MLPSSLALEQSPYRLAVELATPRPCPMVVVTDVDGTLRDPRTGSLTPADLALSMLSANGVPVVLSAPGRPAELIGLQDSLGLVHPFICRNGAEIHIPAGYFSDHGVERTAIRRWEVITLGPSDSLARAMRLLRSLYRSRNDLVVLIGLGDDWDDRFLLGEVDIPVIVRNDAVDQSGLIRVMPHAFVTRASGPAGWSEAILGSASP